MTDTQSLNLGGEGGHAFAFDSVGDTVTGVVKSLAEVQQTDMETGAPAFWPDGKPKMMYAVELATDLRDDPSDDGHRSVYLRGSTKPETQSSLAAVRQAVKATTGSYALQVGGKLTLTYVDEEPAQKKGYSPRKLYSAKYEAPSVSLGGDAGPTDRNAPTPPAATAAAPTAATGAEALSGLTPEQRAALNLPPVAAAVAAAAPAWDADPRVGPLRAAGLPDEQIRRALGL